MYPVPAPAAAAFWAGLRGHMRRQGLAAVPDTLTVPDRLRDHWLEPDLLLSQTCGCPLTTAIKGQVQLVGTPCYAAEGCDGPTYRSLVVVRDDDPARDVADLRGYRAAYNERRSQSGYNALRALVAPLARDGRFFGARVESGAHRHSLHLVRTGVADTAAIDCVTFALLRRYEPERVAGLRVLAQTAGGIPGLPLITALATSPDDVARLRAAFAAACADPALAYSRDALLLTGFTVLPLEAYAACRAMEDAAVQARYPELA